MHIADTVTGGLTEMARLTDSFRVSFFNHC